MTSLLWLLGCGEPEPVSLEGCSALSDATAREDCRLRFIEPLLEGDPAAFERAMAALEDPLSRDLVRLRLAVRQPDRAGALCKDAETEGARDKCRQVLGRPHLAAPRP